MNLEIKTEKNITVIALGSERATITDAPKFKAALVELIDKQGVNKIVVELKGVEFIDSTFLSSLVTGLKLVSEKKGDLKVSHLEPPVRVMFELTRLYKVIEVFGNTAEAVDSF
ncbi:MAG: STAS domain-containing protein [Ignavibacteriales bacterium]|nr:Anti-sigma-B factor antagonist [Ignavibacteriaceae bacterium]MCK6613352.1 STAS domain-containing protein [Ignavibacteriaceae bacterium]QOJ28792.1 MAG: STAS domain-containing protein [Ignavibacteriales bacterium]